MPHVDRSISVTKAKNKLLDLIRRLKTRPEVVAITRDGMPAAVLLSIDQFEGLMETLEILSDPKTMRSLRRSMNRFRTANGSLMRLCLDARFSDALSHSVYPESKHLPGCGLRRSQAERLQRIESPLPGASPVGELGPGRPHNHDERNDIGLRHDHHH